MMKLRLVLILVGILFVAGCSDLSKSKAKDSDTQGVQNVNASNTSAVENASPFEIRIFSATWCKPCGRLHKVLEESGLSKQMGLTLGGVARTIPITFIDVTSMSDDEIIAWNKKSDYMPEIQLLANGQVLGSGTLSPDEEEDSTHFLNIFEAQISKWYEDSLLVRQSLWDTVDPSESLNKKLENSKFSVLFMGTGNFPDGNPIFVGTALKKSKENIKSFVDDLENSSVTLYGAGANPEQKQDAFFIKKVNEGETPTLEYTFFDVHADDSFTPAALTQYFKALRKNEIKKSLLVFAGHGSRAGLPNWGSRALFGVSDFSALVSQSKANPVLVSGNCYGGQFAKAVSCGFFSARPDSLAEGCSPDAAQVEDGYVFEDYSSKLIESLATKDEKILSQSDFNKDGKVSFSEAHWYATIYGGKKNVTYTTLDALADEYFEKAPQELPVSLSKDEAFALLEYADSGEKEAFNFLYSQTGDRPFDWFKTTEKKSREIKNINRIYLKNFVIPFDHPELQAKLKVTPFGEYSNSDFVLDDEAKAKLKARALEDFLKESSSTLDDYKLDHIYVSLNPSRGKGTGFHAWQSFDFNGKSISKGFDATQGLSPDLDQDLQAFLFLGRFEDNNNEYEYRRTLPQVVRRLLFKKLVAAGTVQDQVFLDRVKQVTSCESQSLKEYLR